MKKILIVALILVFAMQLMPFTASAAASAPTKLWVAPSETNGIPAQIDVFKAKTGGSTYNPTYTYQVYLPGDVDPANCLLSWDGGASVTVDNTVYESGACPLPPVDTQKAYKFTYGNRTTTYNIITYQGSPNVQRVFIEIDETFTEEGETQPHTIAAMDGDPDHEKYCVGGIYINGAYYELTKMKGRGNATWAASDDKRAYNVTLGSKINFPGVDSEKTKKWSFMAEVLDHSLLGNRSGFWLAHQIGVGQDTTSADVWMNGEYQGCYMITPKTDSFVTKDGFMIEQDNYLEGVENGGDPQFKLEGLNEASGWSSCYNRITVKKIGDNLLKNSEGVVDESDTNLDYVAQNTIKPWLQDAWDAIRSDTGRNSKGKYYTDYIDIESFAKMYLMHEYVKSYDVCAGSILYYRNGMTDDDKLFAGPLWDLDNALGAVFQNSSLGKADDRRNGDRRSAQGDFIQNITEYKTSVYKTISKHQDFMDEVNRQYNRYKADFDGIEAAAQAMINEISASAMMNHRKVNDLGTSPSKNLHYYRTNTTLGSGEYAQTYLATTDSKTDWPNYTANLLTYIRTRSLWFRNHYYDENYVCEHDYDAVVTPPTCTAAGYTTYTCKYCGDSYVGDETPKIPHDYQNGECAVCHEALIHVGISCAGGASVIVYETQDTTGQGMENGESVHPRDGSTGLIDCSGEGQVNFVVNPLPGYTLAGVSAGPEGTYKNLKDLGDNVYRLTKITGDLTITVSVSGSVAFDPNGGVGTMEPLGMILGEDTALEENGFTRTGYTFAGWNTAADGSGTAYADKDTVNLTENATLYARWTPITYSISYALEGGAAEGNPAEYTIESADILLNAPIRTGYTFAGWTGTDLTGPSTAVTIEQGSTGDRSYTAAWTINRYTITFDTDGGSEIAPITLDYDAAVTAPEAPTKTGYTFAGWDQAIPTTMPAENITIKAQWTINRYTITFDTDGGSAIAPITLDYHAAVTAPEAPTKTGYTFAGWDQAIPTTMPEENITIKALWTINQYTVTFETGGGSLVEQQTVTYLEKAIRPADPTKEGCEFLNWLDENGRPFSFDTPIEGDTTLTAAWHEHTPGEPVREKETAAACTTEGSYEAVVYCTECGKELSRETVTVAALGHDYSSEVTEPTCTEKGYTTYTCSRCQDTRMDYTEALGHDLITHEAKAPSCTEIGWDAYETCSRCDYTTYEELPALAHVPSAAVTENRIEPTCTAEGSYDEVVYCTVCGAELSRESKTIEKLPIPITITAQPVSQTVMAGKTAAFAVEASGEGLSFQWQYSKDGGVIWKNKTGATGKSYTVTAKITYDGILYRCIVSDPAGYSAASDTALLTVTAVPKPVITTHPADQTVAAGKPATFTAAASGEDLVYQWQYSNDGGFIWKNKTGATGDSYTVTAKTSYDGILYRCRVTNAGGSVYSSTAKLTIIPRPIITLPPADQTVMAGKPATFTVAASGENLVYQWQYSNDGGHTWKNKTGATGDSYTVTAKTSYDGILYRCRVTNSGGSVYTAAATLTVTAVPKPVITTHPADQTVAAGKPATFTAAASGEDLIYQWQYSNDGGHTWKNKTGATGDSYTVTAKTSYDGILYRCKVTNSAGGSAYTAAAMLNVIPKPAILVQPADQTAAAGETATFEVKASGDDLTYQWQFSTNGGTTWKNKSGATSAGCTVTAKASYNGILYRCRVKNCSGYVYTASAELTVTT